MATESDVFHSKHASHITMVCPTINQCIQPFDRCNREHEKESMTLTGSDYQSMCHQAGNISGIIAI